MADQPEEPVSQDAQASIDRYRRLLEEEKVECLRERMRAIEERLWYGVDDEEPYFATELAMLREKGKTSGAVPPDLLLITLGYSPEPILLAVAYHAPHRVLFLAEQSLTKSYLARFEELWNHYHAMLGQPSFSELRTRTVRDRPGDLFQEVRSVVEAHRRSGDPRILLDITGAKKTMIAGAFLAAGYLDVEVSYVDFAEYDFLLHRPLPGTSRPEVLVHPLRLFRLREEERLAEAFDQRRYERAADLAGSLQEMAQSPEVIEILGRSEASRQGETFSALARAARACALWASGFFRDAAEALEEANLLPLPPTVDLLTKAWPTKDAADQEIVDILGEKKVFAHPSTALAYFLDVLVWTDEAMLARRPRDTYLRLYGAAESVISYVFEAFVGRRPEVLEIDESRTTREDAIEALRKSSTAMLALLAKGKRNLGEAICRIDRPRLERAVSERFSLARFSDLRHKAIHWMAPVPRARTEQLKTLYEEALRQLVPIAVTEFLAELGAEERAELTVWQERLLAAAGGQIPADCRPWRFADLQAKLRQEPQSGGL